MRRVRLYDGFVVHIGGIPFKVVGSADVETHPGNIVQAFGNHRIEDEDKRRYMVLDEQPSAAGDSK